MMLYRGNLSLRFPFEACASKLLEDSRRNISSLLVVVSEQIVYISCCRISKIQTDSIMSSGHDVVTIISTKETFLHYFI